MKHQFQIINDFFENLINCTSIKGKTRAVSFIYDTARYLRCGMLYKFVPIKLLS